MNVTLLPEALRELDEAVAYYDDQRIGLGGALYIAYQRALEDVIRSPDAHRQLGGGFRKKNLHRFKYKVVYRLVAPNIIVVAFAHHSPRPGYWKGRL